MYGTIFPSTSPIKWYVSFQRKEIIFYLSEVNDLCTYTKWTQRREKAIQFITSSEAQKKADAIKMKRQHNKKMIFKVI